MTAEKAKVSPLADRADGCLVPRAACAMPVSPKKLPAAADAMLQTRLRQQSGRVTEVDALTLYRAAF